MIGPMAPGRVVKLVIGVSEIATAVNFYCAAFGFHWVPEIWSFQFGTYPGDDFFLLSLDAPEPRARRRVGQGHFGYTVDDVDAAHRKARDAGAREWYPPQDNSGAPRSSGLLDPDGNRVELFQA